MVRTQSSEGVDYRTDSAKYFWVQLARLVSKGRLTDKVAIEAMANRIMTHKEEVPLTYQYEDLLKLAATAPRSKKPLIGNETKLYEALFVPFPKDDAPEAFWAKLAQHYAGKSMLGRWFDGAKPLNVTEEDLEQLVLERFEEHPEEFEDNSLWIENRDVSLLVERAQRNRPLDAATDDAAFFWPTLSRRLASGALSQDDAADYIVERIQKDGGEEIPLIYEHKNLLDAAQQVGSYEEPVLEDEQNLFAVLNVPYPESDVEGTFWAKLAHYYDTNGAFLNVPEGSLEDIVFERLSQYPEEYYDAATNQLWIDNPDVAALVERAIARDADFQSELKRQRGDQPAAAVTSDDNDTDEQEEEDDSEEEKEELADEAKDGSWFFQRWPRRVLQAAQYYLPPTSLPGATTVIAASAAPALAADDDTRYAFPQRTRAAAPAAAETLILPPAPTAVSAQEAATAAAIAAAPFPQEIPAPLVSPTEIAAVASAARMPAAATTTAATFADFTAALQGTKAATAAATADAARRLEAAITLPSATPYTTYEYADDKDMPDGDYSDATRPSLGDERSRRVKAMYEQQPKASALYKENTYAAELALMHDLLMQSPWSEHSPDCEENKYQLAREFEQRYADRRVRMSNSAIRRYAKAFSRSLYQVFDDDDYARMGTALREEVDRNVYDDPLNCRAGAKECGECRPMPFDFTPWGTKETFENWTANRPARRERLLSDGRTIQVCEPTVGDHMWLASKVSRNQVPFNLGWYDADLYFAYAALPRLFRMHTYQFSLENVDDKELMERIATYAQQLPQCKNTARNQWEQCVVQYLVDTFSPHANGPLADEEEKSGVRTLLGQLWCHGGFLSTIANKRRMITLIATLALMEQAANGQRPMERAAFVKHVLRFVELISGVYRLSAAVPAVPGGSGLQERQRDWLVNSIGEAMQRNNEPFIRAAYMDYFEHLVLKASVDEERAYGYAPATRKTYIAAESLRWTLWYLSQKSAKPLEIPYDCLVSAIRLLHAKLPRGWYVIDASVLRKFAIVNYDALLECADGNLLIDVAQLTGTENAAALIEQRRRDLIAEQERLEHLKRDAESVADGGRKVRSLSGPANPIVLQRRRTGVAEPPPNWYSYLDRPYAEEPAVAAAALITEERAADDQARADAIAEEEANRALRATLRSQQCAFDVDEARARILAPERVVGDYLVVASYPDTADDNEYRVLVQSEFGPRGFIIDERPDNTLLLTRRMTFAQTGTVVVPLDPAQDYATLEQLLRAELDKPVPKTFNNLCSDSALRGSRRVAPTPAVATTVGEAQLIDCKMSEDEAIAHVGQFDEGAYVVRKSTQLAADGGYRVYVSRRVKDCNDVSVLSFARQQSDDNDADNEEFVLTAVMVDGTHFPVAAAEAPSADTVEGLLAKALPNAIAFRNVCFEGLPPAAVQRAIARNPEGPDADELRGSILRAEQLAAQSAPPSSGPNAALLGAAAALLAGSAAAGAGAASTARVGSISQGNAVSGDDNLSAASVLNASRRQTRSSTRAAAAGAAAAATAPKAVMSVPQRTVESIASDPEDRAAFVRLRRYQRELIDGSPEQKAYETRFAAARQGKRSIEYPLGARQGLVERLQKDGKQYVIVAAEKYEILGRMKRLYRQAQAGRSEAGDLDEAFDLTADDARNELERLKRENPELIALFEAEKDLRCEDKAGDEDDCLDAGCEFSLAGVAGAIGLTSNSCYDPDTQTPGLTSGVRARRAVRIDEPAAEVIAISVAQDYVPFARLRRLQAELVPGSREQAAAIARYTLGGTSGDSVVPLLERERDSLVQQLRDEGRAHVITAASQAETLRRMKRLDREIKEPIGDEAPANESDAELEARIEAKRTELAKLVAEHPSLVAIFEQERNRNCESLTSKGQDVCFSAGCEFHPTSAGGLGRLFVGDLCYDPDNPPSGWRSLVGK